MTLNDKVKIIENKHEKIKKISLFDNFSALGDTSPMSMQLQQNFQKINVKFDEIIDKLNYLLESNDKEEQQRYNFTLNKFNENDIL